MVVLRGCDASQDKNERAQILLSAGEGIPILVFSFLFPGSLFPNKLPSFSLFRDNHSSGSVAITSAIQIDYMSFSSLFSQTPLDSDKWKAEV